MKNKLTGIVLAALLLIGGFCYYKISQLYTQDSATTATSGIFFTKQLKLTEYKQVSKGNDWKSLFMGQYNNYSRSDRHNELVTVYCGNYCK